jgi:hypothetical protein
LRDDCSRGRQLLDSKGFRHVWLIGFWLLAFSSRGDHVPALPGRRYYRPHLQEERGTRTFLQI